MAIARRRRRSFGSSVRRAIRRRSGGGGGRGLLRFLPAGAIAMGAGAFATVVALDKIMDTVTNKGTADWAKNAYLRAGAKIAIGAAGWHFGRKMNSSLATGWFVGCALAAGLDIYGEMNKPKGVNGLAAGPGPALQVPSPGPDGFAALNAASSTDYVMDNTTGEVFAITNN